MAKSPEKEKRLAAGDATPTPTCGMVRPIADMGTYLASHWQEVHAIVAEAAEKIGYNLRLVSDNEGVGIILSDIVSNLYFDPIVICDVSGRNPNVMFELGMRIAFEKPVIIITDDETPFSFDISPIKHIPYPRSLRFPLITEFQNRIASSIIATIEAFDQASHRGYLQQFGPIEITQLGAQQVGLAELAESVVDIRRTLTHLGSYITSSKSTVSKSKSQVGEYPKFIHDLFVEISDKHIDAVVSNARDAAGVCNINVTRLTGGRARIDFAFTIASAEARKSIISIVQSVDSTATAGGYGEFSKGIAESDT